MAIYHCSIKIMSKSKGQSAVAAAAYRSGQSLLDRAVGEIKDYGDKERVVYSNVFLPDHAPKEYYDRETLWNAVHVIEKAKNAQVAREIEVALPIELNRDQQINLVEDYAKHFVSQGMCADVNMHDKGDGNPHAHMMLTMRSIKENGEWAPKSRKVYDFPYDEESGGRIYQKTDLHGRKIYKNHKENYNDWNNPGKAEVWREQWADVCNEHLISGEHYLYIDHRSYERQKNEQEPTIHEGYTARLIEKRGGESERCNYNRQIRLQNFEAERDREKAWPLIECAWGFYDCAEVANVRNSVVINRVSETEGVALLAPLITYIYKNIRFSPSTLNLNDKDMEFVKRCCEKNPDCAVKAEEIAKVAQNKMLERHREWAREEQRLKLEQQKSLAEMKKRLQKEQQKSRDGYDLEL